MSKKIDLEKYDQRIKVRNSVLIKGLSAAFAAGLTLLVPSFYRHFQVSKLLQKYGVGNILDISVSGPLAHQNASMFDGTAARTITFLLEDSNPEAVGNCQITEHMVRNEPTFIASEMKFDTLRMSVMTASPKFDCVFSEDTLCRCTLAQVEDMVRKSRSVLTADGTLILKEYCSSSYSWVNTLAQLFKSKTGSSLFLTHDFDRILKEQRFEVVESRRWLLGTRRIIVSKVS